jgi:thiamine pyrophosphate-dependent acetolactate synthase large subunit-like protein
MSLGTLPLIATLRAHNLIHVVLDNELYESTGGQPTISSEVDLAALAEAAGYARVWRVSDPVSLQQALQEAGDTKILTFILAKSLAAPPRAWAAYLSHLKRSNTAFRRSSRGSRPPAIMPEQYYQPQANP